jgi:hypothetical protein
MRQASLMQARISEILHFFTGVRIAQRAVLSLDKRNDPFFQKGRATS